MQLFRWNLVVALCTWWKLLQGQTVNELVKNGNLFRRGRSCELWKQPKAHHRKIVEFCQRIKNKNWYLYIDCAAFGQYMKSKSRYIDNLKDLVAEYLTDNNQNSNLQSQRGVLNFVGQVPRNYNGHIAELERG
jgi:hypothetical protein